MPATRGRQSVELRRLPVVSLSLESETRAGPIVPEESLKRVSARRASLAPRRQAHKEAARASPPLGFQEAKSEALGAQIPEPATLKTGETDGK